MTRVDVDGVVAVAMDAATTIMIVLQLKRSILSLSLRQWYPREPELILVAGDFTTKTITKILMSPDLGREARLPQQMDRAPQYCNDLSRIMLQGMVEVSQVDHISHGHRVNTSLSLERTPWPKSSISTDLLQKKSPKSR